MIAGVFDAVWVIVGVFVVVEARVFVGVALAETFPPPKSSTIAPLALEYHKPM